MTAADSSLLLDELLSLASNPSSLPQLIDDGTMMSGGDGIDTWNRLMQNIGKQDEIENLESESRNLLFEDLMLREWVRQNLVDNQLHPSSGKAIDSACSIDIFVPCLCAIKGFFAIISLLHSGTPALDFI